MDGDLQHPPEKVRDIMAQLVNGAQLVVGVRVKDLSCKSFVRKAISLLGQTLGRIRLYFRGLKCRDVLSGFFGVETELLKKVIKTAKFEMEGYKMLFDLLKAVPIDIRMKEVPYIFDKRREGHSKLSKRHMILYLKSVVRW
jgi:dolichol-phosphate mannosyltransferase